MTKGYAKLNGLEEVIHEMEKILGETKVNSVVNKALKETGQVIEPEFKKAVSVYKDTGATVSSVVASGVRRDMAIPSVKLGFTSPRWQLVHLNEMGYAKNPHPRGFGVIRRFSTQLESIYPHLIEPKLKEGFKL